MAEDVTLWTNATFTAPFNNGEIAVSPNINNNNDLNAAKVTIRYEVIDPDGENNIVGFLLQAVLEEEVAAGVWVPIAVQQDQVKGTDEAKNQVIEIGPGVVFDPGVAEKVFEGNMEIAAISRTEGVAPGTMRVRILQHITDPAKMQLNSVTVSGWARKFNKP